MRVSGDLLSGAVLRSYKIPWQEGGTAGSLWFDQEMCFAPSVSVYLLQPHSRSGNVGCFCAPASGLYHHFDGACYLHGIPRKEQCTSGAPAVKSHHPARNLVLAGELGLVASTHDVTYLRFLLFTDEAFAFNTSLLGASQKWCSWSGLVVLVRLPLE